MKNRVWQAIVVIVFLVVLSRTALQRDLQASAFEEKINQSLENGYLPVVVLSQESGEYRSLGKSALWAAEYAADKVNENGGVNGCKVQIISENTNSEKSKALSLFQGASRASFLVLGPMDAPETAYIAKNVERNQTINIAAYSFAEIQKYHGTVWNLLYERFGGRRSGGSAGMVTGKSGYQKCGAFYHVGG